MKTKTKRKSILTPTIICKNERKQKMNVEVKDYLLSTNIIKPEAIVQTKTASQVDSVKTDQSGDLLKNILGVVDSDTDTVHQEQDT